MEIATRSILTAIIVSTPSIVAANDVHIYKFDLTGHAPDLEKFRAALDEKKMPGLSVYSGPIAPEGKIVIDQTRHDLPSPDEGEKEPRRAGTLLTGLLTPVPGQPSLQRVALKIRDCKHSAYVFDSKSKNFVAFWTESSTEVVGQIGSEGWCLIDTAPGTEAPRTFFAVHVSSQ